jgi:hypothetical protein
VFLACNFLLIGEKKNGFYEFTFIKDAGVATVQAG